VQSALGHHRGGQRAADCGQRRRRSSSFRSSSGSVAHPPDCAARHRRWSCSRGTAPPGRREPRRRRGPTTVGRRTATPSTSLAAIRDTVLVALPGLAPDTPPHVALPADGRLVRPCPRIPASWSGRVAEVEPLVGEELEHSLHMSPRFPAKSLVAQPKQMRCTPTGTGVCRVAPDVQPRNRMEDTSPVQP
jgi:hypothetical protein